MARTNRVQVDSPLVSLAWRLLGSGKMVKSCAFIRNTEANRTLTPADDFTESARSVVVKRFHSEPRPGAGTGVVSVVAIFRQLTGRGLTLEPIQGLILVL